MYAYRESPVTNMLCSQFFFLSSRRPPIYTLFPYTTLFRSRGRRVGCRGRGGDPRLATDKRPRRDSGHQDRKSTRLNSSHGSISYAVFCLKKKKEKSRDLPSKAQRYLRHAA